VRFRIDVTVPDRGREYQLFERATNPNDSAEDDDTTTAGDIAIWLVEQIEGAGQGLKANATLIVPEEDKPDQPRERVTAVQLRVGDITTSNGRVERRQRLDDGRVELDFKWMGMWEDDPTAGEGGCWQPDDEFWVDVPRPPLVMTNPVSGTYPAE
jgi:hypothetical protein